MAQTDLAVVIVTWNVRELIVDCLQSVFDDFAHSDLRGEIWVVDNMSTDGTVEAIRTAFPPDTTPNLHLLEPGENLGFGRGNNAALQAAGYGAGGDAPPYALLLNPDTVVRPGALGELINGMEATGAGLGGARLVFGDGSFQHSAFAFPGLMQLIIELFPVPGRFYESELNGRYPRELYAGERPFEVDHPLGAAFLLRREVIEQTGMFDERFQLYCEEIDWAMRIHEAGWNAVCIPTAEVIHYGGYSTGQARPASIINLWTARLQLYRKHYGFVKNLLARWIIRAGMNRLIRQTARDTTLGGDEVRRDLVNAYREVIRLSRKI